MSRNIVHMLDDMSEQLAECKGVVVLGNSGSLLETVPQTEWSDQLFVIGTNRILRMGVDGRKYKPDLIMINDRRAIFSTGDADRLRNRGGIALALGDTVYNPNDTCKNLGLPPHVPHDYIWAIESMPNMVAGRGRTGVITRPPAWSNPSFQTIGNISFIALQLAIMLNIGPVLLLGVENKFPTKQGRRSHFYTVSEIDDTRHRPFPVAGSGVKYWYELAKWCNENNKHVYDGSPWAECESKCEDGASSNPSHYRSSNTGLVIADANPILTTGRFPVSN